MVPAASLGPGAHIFPMKYDVASKVLLSRCKDEILRHFAGLPIKSSTLLETAPQETVSRRRADFVLRTELEDGSRRLVLRGAFSPGGEELPIDWDGHPERTGLPELAHEADRKEAGYHDRVGGL